MTNKLENVRTKRRFSRFCVIITVRKNNNISKLGNLSNRRTELNARHPDVLLMTIKIYKYRQNTTKFIILYHFRATCFDSLELSSGPLMN